jgi:hypothetical protein
VSLLQHSKSKIKQNPDLCQQTPSMPLFLCAESKEERRGYEEKEVTPVVFIGEDEAKAPTLYRDWSCSGGSAAFSSKQGNLAGLNWHQVYRQCSDYCKGTQNSRKDLVVEGVRCIDEVALQPFLES